MNLSQLIARFALRHWRHYLSSAIMLAGVAALTVWIPRQVGHVVDELVSGRLHGEALLRQLGLLLAAGIGIYGLRVGWRLQLYAASYRLGQELRVRLYRRLTEQGPSFFQQQRTGDLMALATNDVDAVEMAAGEAMLAGFDGSMTLIMVVAMMSLAINPQLALVALAPFPLMALAFWRISNQIHLASRDSLKCFSALNDFTQETLSGVRTIRALGLEQRSSRQFADLAEHAADASLRAQRWEAGYEPAVGLTLVTASTLTLGVGGTLVWQGEMTVGALTAFSMYLGQLIWPMFAAGWVLALMERGRAAWARLAPVLEQPLSILDHGTISPVALGLLSVENIHLIYPGQREEALNGVSFTLEPGRTLGLVGPTGAGKSSIIRLILRQYAESAGTLRWSGIALADYELEALHGAISWVPQEPFMFSASIAENIALTRPDATRSEIEHVARLAAIHEDIVRFPLGYETPVGERGVTLSGGQRQRLAIARALLADAGLLLLDDALSAVDTQTESAILSHLAQEQLSASASGKSMMVVSHRLSSVKDADEILVLDAGRVIERGNHVGLVAQDGWYAAQWRYQQLEASLEAV
jgi:ATP-binding cassette subfamily B protein/ATP-binding cassette subfamily C protein/ATP-binding cassette subfamily B multidrug efflux pump